MSNLNDLDWNHIRAFLVVAEAGSLTAAAERLEQSQPTLGRHIHAAEAILGAELFTRTAHGLDLSEIGVQLLEPAKKMARASAQFANIASSQDQQLAGTVRITASLVVSHYILPSIISKLRASEPEIEIELFPSDATENLLYREADIAVRMYRPTQLDVITKHISDQTLALYATPEFIRQNGQPKNLDELSKMPFVGFDRSDMIIRAFRDIGEPVDRHFFGVRCDNQAVYWEMTCAGCGVGAMQTQIGDADPRVIRLDFQPELPKLPIWLTAPKALRTNARIRRVWDILVDELGKA